MVEQGYSAATIDAIARAAGVARTTVYRRWPNRATLVFDAIFEATETIEVPDTGSLRSDLVALLQVFGGELSSPAAAQALVAVMADVGVDSETSKAIRGVVGPRAVELGEIVNRARQRGEIRDGVDPELVIHSLAGILYYHAAVLGLPIAGPRLDEVVDLVISGLAPRTTKGAKK